MCRSTDLHLLDTEVMNNKMLVLATAAISIAGLNIARSTPVLSAACGRATVNLNSVLALTSIPINAGIQRVTVNNQSPFITGMRVRATSGTTLATTKFVEGRVGSVSNCVVALQVDRTLGTGSVKNAKFAFAGEIGQQGLSGPQGVQGQQGVQGIQGVQGLQGIAGTNGSNGVNGINGTNGLNGINGFIPKFGSFSDTTTQQVDLINTPKAMTFNQITPGVNGVVANGVSVVSSSRLTVAVGGIYNLVYSAQLTKTDAGNDTMDIWLRINGVDVPLSNSESTLSTTQRLVSTSSWMLTLASGDYVQLMYSSADINTHITAMPAQTAPVRPAGPSVITTIIQVQ